MALLDRTPLLLAQVSPHEIVTYLPILGPLLAGEAFWRLLTVLVLLGLPMREEVRTADGHVITRWRWRGALAIGWEWAQGRRAEGEARRLESEARKAEGEALARIVRRVDRLFPLIELRLGATPSSESAPPPPPGSTRPPHDPLKND